MKGLKVISDILQNSQENTCARAYSLIPVQVFSFEFRKIVKNTYF